MLECGTTNRDPAHTVHKAAGRFDARRIYTVLFVVPLLYAAIRYLPPAVFTGHCGGGRLSRSRENCIACVFRLYVNH